MERAGRSPRSIEGSDGEHSELIHMEKLLPRHWDLQMLKALLEISIRMFFGKK